MAALATTAALTACGGSSTHGHTSTGPTVNPHRLVSHGNAHMISIFGGASQLMQNPAPVLSTLKQLGVQVVRIDVRWNEIAPDPSGKTRPKGFDAANPASYPAAGWAQFDNAIRAAHADGIGVLATIGGPGPLWAEEPGDPLQVAEPVGIWKPKPAEFAAFVQAVSTRYTGLYRPAGAAGPLPWVTMWSIWNEPNYGQDLAPQATDRSTIELAPAFYRGLLDAGYGALTRSAHGPETILFGELAPHGQTVQCVPGVRCIYVPGNFGGMVPLRFLRALYCVNGSFQRLSGTAATERGCPSVASSATATAFRAANPALFDSSGLAAHLYPFGPVPPTQSAPGEPDYADISTLDRLETTLRQAIRAYGVDTVMPIYNTEFGYQTDPPESGYLKARLAAAYLNEAEYMSWADPAVRSYDQYLLNDPAPVPGKQGFNTGIVFSSGKPKPGFFAYRMPIWMPRSSGAKGSPLEVWGCARPAPDAQQQTGRPQQVAIEFKPAAGSVGATGASGTTTSPAAFAPIRTVTLSPGSCYLDVTVRFPESGTVRLEWRPAAGRPDFSRRLAVTVR